eukprot:scaffold59969_cov31-Tisochrysis_lutea.AAC.5
MSISLVGDWPSIRGCGIESRASAPPFNLITELPRFRLPPDGLLSSASLPIAMVRASAAHWSSSSARSRSSSACFCSQIA